MSEVFSVKVIKPKKLKVKEYRLELLNALRAEGRAVTKEYKKVTRTWKGKPKFETLIGLTGKDASVLVGTDDKIFRFVDEGTRPHLIRPRKARMLRFRSGYRAKTTPGKIGSRSGGPYGKAVYAKVVRHPGNRPGGFSPAIQKRRRKPFTRGMVAAMHRAAEKSF